MPVPRGRNAAGCDLAHARARHVREQRWFVGRRLGPRDVVEYLPRGVRRGAHGGDRARVPEKLVGRPRLMMAVDVRRTTRGVFSSLARR